MSSPPLRICMSPPSEDAKEVVLLRVEDGHLVPRKVRFTEKDLAVVLEDQLRKASIAWDALKGYLAHDSSLQTGTHEVQKLYSTITAALYNSGSLGDKLRSDILNFLDERFASQSSAIHEGDRFFCMRLLFGNGGLDENLQRLAPHSDQSPPVYYAKDFIEKWAEFKFGRLPPRLKLIGDETKRYDYLMGDREEIRLLDVLYADIVLGKENREFLEQEAGIRRFLRYPQPALLDTLMFLQDKSDGGKTVFLIAAESDHNGAFYSHYYEFYDLHQVAVGEEPAKYAHNRYRLVIMEAFDEDSVLERMRAFTKKMDDYEANFGKDGTRSSIPIDLQKFIIAGHGDPFSIQMGAGSDERFSIDVEDEAQKYLFTQMKEIWHKYKFKEMYVMACSVGEQLMGSTMANLAEHWKGILSKKVFALPEDGLSKLMVNPTTRLLSLRYKKTGTNQFKDTSEQ